MANSTSPLEELSTIIFLKERLHSNADRHFKKHENSFQNHNTAGWKPVDSQKQASAKWEHSGADFSRGRKQNYMHLCPFRTMFLFGSRTGDDADISGFPSTAPDRNNSEKKRQELCSFHQNVVPILASRLEKTIDLYIAAQKFWSFLMRAWTHQSPHLIVCGLVHHNFSVLLRDWELYIFTRTSFLW